MLPQTLLLSLLALTPLASAQNYGGGGGSSSSSTSSSSSPASTTSSSKSSSASTIHTVTVGAGGGLDYQPDTLTAAVGDTIIFNFQPGDHSVAQSTFGAPCTPSSNGIWSGFFASTTNAFVVTVNNTDPLWFYCAQVGHCNAGMAMVVNPP
jgi:plastocyanin